MGIVSTVGLPLAAAIFGAFLFEIVRRLFRWWDERRGPLRGRWWQHIPPFQNEPEKLDKMTMRHNSRDGTLAATIERELPQAGKKWKFDGYVRDSLIFGVFLNDDPNEMSYGTMRLIVSASDKSRWTGEYTRLHLDQKSGKLISTILNVPVTWSRGRPATQLAQGSRPPGP